MSGAPEARENAGWIRRPDPTADFAANPVELFFDLAFVFAFAELVSYLVHHPDVEGIFEAALLFWMLWLAWSQFTWAANAVSAHARNVQVIILVATVASVPMAASITTGLSTGGYAFVASVVVIVTMGQLLLIMASPVGSPAWRTSVGYAIPNALAMVLFLVGAAFTGEAARVVFWLIGIMIIVWDTVKAGRGEWIVRPRHFTERHGLILIVALGEIIAAVAIPVIDAQNLEQGLPGETITSLIFAGLFAVLLWWAYFDRPRKVFEHHLKELHGRRRAVFARDVYTYLHSLIVFGVVVAAAGLEEITLHPSDVLPQEFRVMFLIGLILFFVSIELSALRAFHRVPPERAVAIIALTVVVLAGESLEGIWMLAIVDGIIFVALVLEAIRLEGRLQRRRVS